MDCLLPTAMAHTMLFVGNRQERGSKGECRLLLFPSSVSDQIRFYGLFDWFARKAVGRYGVPWITGRVWPHQEQQEGPEG